MDDRFEFVVQVVRVQAGCLGNPAGCENPTILRQIKCDKEVRFGTKSGSFPAGGGPPQYFECTRL